SSFRAFSNRFPSRFVSANTDECDLARQQSGCLSLSKKSEINFLDDFEHGLRLEGRTIETLLDRSQKLRVEGFLLQTQEFVTTGIADAHSLPPCQWLSSASITGVPFGKMVGAACNSPEQSRCDPKP